MVACWLGDDPWLRAGGLGRTGTGPPAEELWRPSEAVCGWGWIEAVCSNWVCNRGVGGAWC